MKLTNNQVDALNHCLKCSICVDSCPVSRVNPMYPGPKNLGVDWLRIAQENGDKPNPLVSFCSNCKTCETVCPSGVLVATLNQLAKKELPKSRLGLTEEILSDPSRLGKTIHIWPQAGNIFVGLRPVRFLAENTVGISAKAPMPLYSTKTLNQLIQRIKPQYTQTPQEVLYFPGCYAQYNNPEVGVALVKLLALLNYKVIIPDFKCCGQPSISNARLDVTRKFAVHNLKILKEHMINGRKLLFSCPSCMLTFREEYQNLLGLKEYARFASSMLDAGSFLLDYLEVLKNPVIEKQKQKQKQDLRLAYHEPCHLRALGQGTASLLLLKNIAELKVIPLEAGCCGMSGSYGLKKEKQWISNQIGNDVKNAIANLKVNGVTTECGMCSVQIKHISKLPVYHPLELLVKIL